jgi:hypothetical protein
VNPELASEHPQTAEQDAPSNGQRPRFRLRQRIALAAISWAGFLAIRLIGPTLRTTFTREPGTEDEPRTRPAIYCFWHRCVFACGYLFRNHGIRVLTSRSYDGECIARVIEKLRFRAIRGSSSRGAVSALRELQRELEAGAFVAFTIDGPRGPKYVAKPGPIHLSRATAAPIFCFYVAVERAWILKSWDAFMLPKPFSRVHCYVCSPFVVPADAEQDDYLPHMQAELERARINAEKLFE